MDSETIVKEIKDIFVKDATLKTYIKTVLIGDRELIYGSSYPVIVIDVPADPLSKVLEGNVRENNLSIRIIPAILVTDREKALIGDDTHKGILDVVKDIKSALNGKYPTLNKTCLYFTISTPEISDFPDLKGKYATIEMSITYREAI